MEDCQEEYDIFYNSEYCTCDSMDYEDGWCLNCGKPVEL